jgi:hypothetical protein
MSRLCIVIWGCGSRGGGIGGVARRGPWSWRPLGGGGRGGRFGKTLWWGLLWMRMYMKGRSLLKSTLILPGEMILLELYACSSNLLMMPRLSNADTLPNRVEHFKHQERNHSKYSANSTNRASSTLGFPNNPITNASRVPCPPISTPPQNAPESAAVKT